MTTALKDPARRNALATMIAMALPWGSARADEGCSARAAYAGPPRRSAPDAIWQRDFGRAIDGELPADLQQSLGDALDRMLQHLSLIHI